MLAGQDPLTVIPNVLLQTLSPDKALRVQAEEYLKQMSLQPRYVLMLLEIIKLHSAGPTEPDISIRKCAAVQFKNAVKKKWSPEEEGELAEVPLSEDDKNAVKQAILMIMCGVPSDVQKQLSEALTIICKYDFPAKWESLLPDMVIKFATQDFHVINGVLLSANAILKRFRYAFKTDDLYRELAFCLANFSKPLTELFVMVFTMVESSGNDQARLKLLFEALRLICRIFYSLNWQDLPEFFEENMETWMPNFRKLLSYKNPLLIDEDEDEKAGPLELVHAAIVENVNLYADKYEEEFNPYLEGFATAVWELLQSSGTTALKFKYDPLITTSMKFLTSLVSKQMYIQLFNNPTLLRQIIETIVVPNIIMREKEEELFEDNPHDYIQMDMEGSDNDSRRRCSCDLVRGMCRNFDEVTTSVCMEYLGNMLSQYAANPADWRPKDAAITLMLAITVRAESHLRGVSELNDKVNLMEFLTQHILPELDDSKSNKHVVVTADCIKFVSTFRSQFLIEHLRALMPMLIKHLTSTSVVVQTYAAACIEKLLTVKDVVGGKKVPRLNRVELQPFLQPLFTNLFSVLDRADTAENEYVMKAIMRILSVVQDEITPVVPIVLDKLTNALARVCKNPTNPLFNHYLFEAMASLVSSVCRVNPNSTTDFEALLFPPFESVLAMDVAEFTPYVFQILAELLRFRPNGMSQAFASLIPPLLNHTLWERKSNVPALVLLMQSYLLKGGMEIASKTEPILGIFQNLLATKAFETYAFDLLCSIIDNIDPSLLKKYLKTIFELCLNKLQKMSPRYIRLYTHFLGVFIGKFGARDFVQVLDSIQPSLSLIVLKQVWLGNIQMAAHAGGKEAKSHVVGLTRVLVEFTEIHSDPETWGSVLSAILKILVPEFDGKTKQAEEEEEDYDKEMSHQELTGEAVYSKLHFASGGEHDWFPSIPDAKAFLVHQLNGLLSVNAGQFTPIMQKSLTPQQLQSLQLFFEEAGIHFR